MRVAWIAPLVLLAACSSASTPTTSSPTRAADKPADKAAEFVRWAATADTAVISDALSDSSAAADTGSPAAMILACIDGVDAMDEALDVMLPTPDAELSGILSDAIGSLRAGFSGCAAGDFSASTIAGLTAGGRYFDDATVRLDELRDEFGI